MTMSLISYRSTFLERVLDLLWRQWSSLGISGSADDWRGGLIDPEHLRDGIDRHLMKAA